MRLPVPLLATLRLRTKLSVRPAMSCNFSSESAQAGPVETSIRQKVWLYRPRRSQFILTCCSSLQLNDLFKPTALEISNDSSQHRHHTAMRAQGGGNGETRKSQLLKAKRIDIETSLSNYCLFRFLRHDRIRGL